MAVQPSGDPAEKFFRERNVWVLVLAQEGPGELKIHEVGEVAPLPADSEDYQHKRIAVNFEVTKDDQPLSVFEPPMELRVGLTEAEVKELRAEVEKGKKPEEHLKLAYCFVGDKAWTLFTVEKHGYKVDLDCRDAVVWISNWDDATVGVGR